MSLTYGLNSDLKYFQQEIKNSTNCQMPLNSLSVKIHKLSNAFKQSKCKNSQMAAAKSVYWSISYTWNIYIYIYMYINMFML